MPGTPDGPLTPVDLRVEHCVDPVAIDEPRPQLSWRLQGEGHGRRQTEWRIIAASTRAAAEALEADLWDSGRRPGSDTLGIAWGGRPLASLETVWWRVEASDEAGRTAWSAPASFGVGPLSEADWAGDWIGAPVAPPGGIAAPGSGPAADPWGPTLYQQQARRVAYLRGRFEVLAPVCRARLFATARGLFRLWLDGAPVDDRVFAPGWTDYRQRIEVVALDLTDRMQVGSHVLAAQLGEGWYAGHVGFRPKQRGAHYGILPWFRAMLVLDHADGSRAIVATDAGWRWAPGGIVASDLLMGEIFDARCERDGWTMAEFDDSGWEEVAIGPPTAARLVAERGPPIRVVETLAPRSLVRRGDHLWQADFGQNLAGRVRLRANAPADARIRLRHAEALEPDGSLHTANLRTARAEDLVVSGGRPLDYAPTFTFHGFRHAEFEGPLEGLSIDDVRAEAIMSAMPEIGHFRCSNPMVNQLWRNILWGQRGNFLSVPTDCPQRDERLGWTGDAQVFAMTAALNMEVAAFFAKWLIDLVDAQRPDGLFTDVAPLILFENGGAPGWGDAGIILPWTLWRMTGDRSFIDRFWEAMTRHIERVAADNPDGLRTRGCNLNFGDWLSIDEETPRDLVATAWFARIADLMARLAGATGRGEAQARYADLFSAIRRAFGGRFLLPDGRLAGDSQTGYLMALGFGLLDADESLCATARLVEKIEARGHRLTSGFMGANLLLPVLCAQGHADTAMKLLLQEEFPSWGFSIRHGATTIWERWDSWTPERGFQEGMNSFNHYAFGSVGEWLYRGLGGLDYDEAAPPLARVRVAPEILAAVRHGISWCETSHDSARGRVSVRWEADAGDIRCEVLLPPNMEATIRLPGNRLSGDAPGNAHLVAAGAAGFEGRVGSGLWRFQTRMDGHG